MDFNDLNKSCGNDPFPLPHIDSFVDTIVSPKILTFMDASIGFQQILMEPSSQQDTSFITPTCIYYYITIPFGLKNTRATYQILVKKMFKHQLGKTMEVYIDDMVVKFMKAKNHIHYLEEAFNILDQLNMKLNPSKCHFGVKVGKLLGYRVTKRGIEASPKQSRAIINLQSVSFKKDVERFIGRVVALDMFISKAYESCKPFYDVLRKNKSLNGHRNIKKLSKI